MRWQEGDGTLSSVRRIFFHLLLLVSVVFHGVGIAAAPAKIGLGDHDPGHSSLHLQDVAHHHHDEAGDESALVLDGSAESASHLASDGALSSPVMPAVLSVLATIPPSASLPGWQQPVPRSPDLRTLLRPPRHTL